MLEFRYIPGCYGPVFAATSSRATILENRLEDSIIARRFNGVEEEDGLAVLGGGNSGDFPGGSKGADRT